MTEKLKIIDVLGEKKLLLPKLVNEALNANDRVKYFFTLLQMAKEHADNPQADVSDLRKERFASGVTDNIWDNVVLLSEKISESEYKIPKANQICVEVVENLRRMLAPIVTEANGNGCGKLFAERLQKLIEENSLTKNEIIKGAQIDEITSGRREQGDSLHLLVMDLHKELNQIQARISEENINGASVYEISDEDRLLITAFMSGVNKTAPLKFDHPGLATTATRSNEKLVIQNDIGTTDAHVLVVHVVDKTVTVTYTDVHLQRLMFFQSLFESFDVQWEDTRSRKNKNLDDGVYHLCLGIYKAKNKDELKNYLAFLGSRLVFLIDWNRARKRLRNFVPKRDCISLLKWAAANNYGHMAFLKAGGEALIFDAMEFASKGRPFHFGEQLHEMLGREQANQYLKFVLKTASEGLLGGRSELLIRDEVRAELFNYFRSAQQSLFDVIAEHSAFVIEIAASIRDGLLKANFADTKEIFAENARRAKDWEKKADDLVNFARAAVKHSEDSTFFRELIEAADDIADDLEEAAFNLTLLPSKTFQPELLKPFQSLTDLLLRGAQEYLKVVETARCIHKEGTREDMQDFLEAVHRIISIEHQTDEAQRNVRSVLVKSVTEFQQLYVFSETAKRLEESADNLMHTALMLRDYILGKVMVS